MPRSGYQHFLRGGKFLADGGQIEFPVDGVVPGALNDGHLRRIRGRRDKAPAVIEHRPDPASRNARTLQVVLMAQEIEKLPVMAAFRVQPRRAVHEPAAGKYASRLR